MHIVLEKTQKCKIKKRKILTENQEEKLSKRLIKTVLTAPESALKSMPEKVKIK